MPSGTSILLYSPTISPRLRYIAGYLFEDLLGLSLYLSDELADFEQFAGPKCYYSSTENPDVGILLRAHKLLFSTDLVPFAVSTGICQDIPTLCAVPPGGVLPFDPLAASFYLLSRYEEYTPYTADTHGRYPADTTWLSRVNYLERPIIWEWAKLLRQQLQIHYPSLRFPPRTYRFAPTYDVDLPWAFRHRGWRAYARAGLDLLQANWSVTRARIDTWAARRSDPFFTFPYLRELHQQHGIRPRIFWLLAGQRTRYDINPDPNTPAFQQLIRSSTAWADPGLHPSYTAFTAPEQLELEHGCLSTLLGHPITHSRQHYLRLKLPHTYHQLLAAGIRNDYTMGFASTIGYRAGTSEPFRWFDLSQNTVTALVVHPFVAMDQSLRKYLAINPQEAQERLQTISAYCQTEGLTFSTLWHNSSFSDAHGWAGWSAVYEGLF